MSENQITEMLYDAASTLIEEHGGGSQAERLLLPHWRMFLDFLGQSGMVTDSIADIQDDTLREFSRFCDLSGSVAFHDAPLVLGAVRLILRWSGRDRGSLIDLSAPRGR